MAEQVTYRDAIRLALEDAMEADPRVVILGEDIGAAGGPFKITVGLRDRFGPERVMDTPISETGFVGASIGLALAGYRPVAELMFADFAAVAWDQIVNEAAKYRYLSAGQMPVPMVIRAGGGAGGRFASQHSQTTESWYLSIAGLKVVAPSNVQDAYGLLRTAVEDPDPVIYIEHRGLYPVRGQLERGLRVPIGSAAVARPGAHITIVASLAMVSQALQAAELLADSGGPDVEVIDLRSLSPMDTGTLVASVRKTGRLLTVEEQSVLGGWGGTVVAAAVEGAFDDLDAPPARMGLPEAPIPFSPGLEDAAVPGAQDIAARVRSLLAG